MEKNRLINRFSATLLCVVILLVVQVSVVSAWDFDNVKETTDVVKGEDYNIGDSILKYNDLWEKYKPIKVDNMFGLGSTLFSGAITEHTEYCREDCSSTMEIYLANDGILIDEVIFETKQKDNSWVEQNVRSYQFYIKTDEKPYLVDDFELQCINGKFNELNKSYQQICTNVKVGNHTEYISNWTQYNLGDEVVKGNYIVKLEAEKKSSRTVDWIIKTNGEWLDEWATWATDLNTNLVSYYPLDNDDFDDLLGNHNGTNYGSSNDSGIINDSRSFTTNDYISATCSAISDKTLSVWFKTTDTGETAIFTTNNNGIGGSGEGFGIMNRQGSGGVSFLIDGVYWGLVYTDCNDGNWHNAILSRAHPSGEYKMYVDGVSVNNVTQLGGKFSSSSTLIGATGGGAYFEGSIDEPIIWNRILTQAEVEGYYNSGDPAYLNESVLDAPVVTLNFPADSSYSTGQEIEFNCSSVVGGGSTLTNMTLWTNNTASWALANTTDVTGTTNTTTWNNTITGNTLWSCQACDSDGDCAFATSNYTVNLDNTYPTIIVETPDGTLNSATIGDSETLNVTFTDTNLDDCWYDYNSTNITINGCLTGIKNSTTFILENGNYNMTVYANDSVGNLNSTSLSWSYNLTEVSQTYFSTAVESSTKTYVANLSYNSSAFGVITGDLYLNGSSYTGTRTGAGDSAVFSANAIMPSISTETNYTAYWTISLTDAGGTTDYNLTSHNITVSTINLSLCDATNNVSFWNFTILNESNAAEINSTFEATFTVTPTGSSSGNDFSYSDIVGNNSQYDFCISPGTESYSIDTNIELGKTGYVSKFYNYKEVTVNNTTKETNLYMLTTADSTSFIIHVVDAAARDIVSAEVRVLRYYTGTDEWLVTEIVTTDDSGESIAHLLSEDADYKFQVYQSGVSTYNSSLTKIVCAASPCTVTLIIPISVATGIEEVEDLTSTLTYSSTTNTFTYTYVDTSATFDTARLYVVRIAPSNATVMTPCNETRTTASGVITCDINGGVNGTYRASGYIARSDVEFLNLRIDGRMGTNIYNSMGDDGILWAIFLFIAIAMLGVARPSLAIVFGTMGLIVVGLLGIINIGALSIVAVSTVAVILLMRVGRE